MIEITNNFSEIIQVAKDFVESKKDRIEYNKNNLNFSDLKNKGVVYFIFVTEKETQNTQLKYIGKSKSNLFKQRLTNHFDHSHYKTSTKRSEIEKEILKKNKVEYSYLITQPESLRNLIEEELICFFKDKTSLWNGKQTNKTCP